VKQNQSHKIIGVHLIFILILSLSLSVIINFSASVTNIFFSKNILVHSAPKATTNDLSFISEEETGEEELASVNPIVLATFFTCSDIFILLFSNTFSSNATTSHIFQKLPLFISIHNLRN